MVTYIDRRWRKCPYYQPMSNKEATLSSAVTSCISGWPVIGDVMLAVFSGGHRYFGKQWLFDYVTELLVALGGS